MSEPRGSVFRYRDHAIDAEHGVLTCRYELDGREFTERVTLPPGEQWHTGPARAAARLVFLLSGVSYYKTAASPVIDFGETALTGAEEAFLREFYLQGLGEFAYRNHLDLTSLGLRARSASPGGDDPPQTPPDPGGKPFPPDPLGPLGPAQHVQPVQGRGVLDHLGEADLLTGRGQAGDPGEQRDPGRSRQARRCGAQHGPQRVRSAVAEHGPLA